MKKIFAAVLLALVGMFASGSVLAAMSSASYRINADVIGAGGDLGTSASYKLFDTMGEPVIGIGQSETFSLGQGFQYMLSYSISMNIDSSNVDLGEVLPGTPRTGQSVVSVTTDSWGGYDLAAHQNHPLQHTDTVTTVDDYACAISAPCFWSGVGLGFTVASGTGVDSKWGTNPNYKYAAFPLVATTFHSKSGFTSGPDDTTVQYKVDTPSTQKSGVYSNMVTYTATTKL